jgi:uncharacterized protein (DUF488 family)
MVIIALVRPPVVENSARISRKIRRSPVTAPWCDIRKWKTPNWLLQGEVEQLKVPELGPVPLCGKIKD